MSEPSRLRAYRACVNLPEAMNGHLIWIDDTDPRWQDRIRGGLIAAVGPPVGYEPPEVPFTRENPPDELDVTVGDVWPPNPHIGDLPLDPA